METYNGHVRTPADAILLFEACRIGLLPRVQRRLSEKERQQIKSGSVFVWDEREAGMRRWTDGKSWSASRVSGSFLTYREMEGKRGGNGFAPPTKRNKSEGSKTGESDEDSPDGYRYKPDGLMKQSFSITTSNGQHLHLISYYARSHHSSGNLMQPTNDPNLRHIRPPKNMYPESAVNEASSVPAVTRGPMPGSPYAQAPIALGSPYRPGGPHPPYIPGPWPPTPVGTPPGYVYAYYAPAPGHSPLQYAAYPPPYAHPHPGAPTYLDRPPPQIAHPGLPPPPSHLAHGLPPHMQAPTAHLHPYSAPPPQYLSNPAQRTSHPPPILAHGQPIYPPTQIVAPPPEHFQGPQLPALTGTASPTNGEKPPSPRPADSAQPRNPNNSLPVPESSGASQGGASPARTIPSVGSLLNGNPTDTPTSATADARSDHGSSRAGSRSPNDTASSSRNARDIPGEKFSAAGTDQMALHRLNKAAFTT